MDGGRERRRLKHSIRGSGRILELGCGEGRDTAHLVQLADVVAVDYSESSLQQYFYKVGGHSKRFFDRRSVLDLFGNWDIEAMEERVILRYERPKWVWELSLRAGQRGRMRKLVVGCFVTLDGVMQAPGGPNEDRDGGFAHGGWLVPYFDARFLEFMTEWTQRAGAFLFGRKTYEIFAESWPKSADPADEIAKSLNTRPKFVATRTLAKLHWSNSTLLKGDVAQEVAKLKSQPGGEIQVHGSGNLLQTLLRHDLVDTLRIWQFPVVLGTGKRLFGEGTIPRSFRLVDTQHNTTGAVLLVYERVGGLKYGEVEVGQDTVIFDSGASHL